MKLKRTRNTEQNTEPRYLPASRIYSAYGVPRSLLRSLAENGDVKCIDKLLPNCENVMHLYSVADVKKCLNKA